jgi:hypothetical protein
VLIAFVIIGLQFDVGFLFHFCMKEAEIHFPAALQIMG